MWLTFQPEGARTRLTWGNEAGPHPITYKIGTDTLAAAAEALRQQLEKLTEWGRGELPDQLPALLRQLIAAGSDLRFVLFDAEENNGRIEQWMAETFEAGDRRLSITANPDIHVPWGLVFEGDPSAIPPDARTINQFERGLWSLKFDLSVVFSETEPARTKRPRSRESFRILGLIDRREYEYIAKDPAIHMEHERLFKNPVGMAFNLETCHRKIGEASRKDTIFYFFGHGIDGELEVGSGERVNVIAFRKMLKALTDRDGDRAAASLGLVFLNACDTAVGNSDYTLRSAAARPGLCGLVATEAIVPRDFAVKFGLSFLRGIIDEGKSVGEAMSSLRRDQEMWPLSLLYGSYASPDFRIVG